MNTNQSSRFRLKITSLIIFVFEFISLSSAISRLKDRLKCYICFRWWENSASWHLNLNRKIEFIISVFITRHESLKPLFWFTVLVKWKKYIWTRTWIKIELINIENLRSLFIVFICLHKCELFKSFEIS